MAYKRPIILINGELYELDTDNLQIPNGANFNTDLGDNDFIVNSQTGIALQYDMGKSLFGVGRAPTQEFDFYSADGGEMDFLIENGSSGEMKFRLKNPAKEWEINNASNGDFSIRNNTVDSSQPVIYINESVGIERLRFTASNTLFNNDNYDVDVTILAPMELQYNTRSATNFTGGETFTATPSGVTGTIVSSYGNTTAGLVRYEGASGTIQLTDTITGDTSGATCNVVTNNTNPNAYKYDAGSGSHGWGKAPNTDFHFYKKQGDVTFRLESGDLISKKTFMEFQNLNEKWIIGADKGGHFIVQNDTLSKNLITLRRDANYSVIYARRGHVRFNNDYDNVDIQFRKLTAGTWINYDCGTDNLDIDVVDLDIIAPIDIFADRVNKTHTLGGGSGYSTLDMYSLDSIDGGAYIRMYNSVDGLIHSEIGYYEPDDTLYVASKNGSTVAIGRLADDSLLNAQPTGTVDLAIATTKYVNDAVSAEDFWQRNTTTLSPQNTGDSLSIDGGANFNTNLGDNDFIINQQTITASITAFTDGGGGEVTATATAHGFGLGDTVTISGTTNYDGSYTINAVTANDFDFTATFIATETGTATVDKDAYTFDAGLRQHRFDSSNADFLIQSTSYNQPATLFLESTADTETEIQMKGVLSDWKMNLTRGDFAITENGVGEKFAINRLGTVSGQWLFLEASKATFNKGFDNRNFVVNKLTSGEAFQYDAGLDTTTINSDEINLYSPTSNFTLNMQSSNGTGQLWQMYFTGGNNLTLNDGTDDRIVMVNTGAGGQWLQLESGQIVTNYAYRNQDFIIRSDTTGVDAFKYDAGLDTTEINSQLTITLNSVADGARLTTQPTGTVDTAIATTKYVDSNVGIPTGTIQDYISSIAPAGWLQLNGQTIGSASSGATYANADAQTLFELLWDSMADSEAPVSTGRGASANADWTANKTITLPDARGRTTIGSGTGSGLTTRINGDTNGAETHQLSTAEMPSHVHAPNSHGFVGSITGGTHAFNNGSGSYDFSGYSQTAANGSDIAHNNMQPWLALYKIIKL